MVRNIYANKLDSSSSSNLPPFCLPLAAKEEEEGPLIFRSGRNSLLVPVNLEGGEAEWRRRGNRQRWGLKGIRRREEGGEKEKKEEEEGLSDGGMGQGEKRKRKGRRERRAQSYTYTHRKKTITHPSSPLEHTCLNSVFEFWSNLKNAAVIFLQS